MFYSNNMVRLLYNGKVARIRIYIMYVNRKLLFSDIIRLHCVVK